MTIHELLTNSKSQFSLDVFSAKSIAAVEAALTEKNGALEDEPTFRALKSEQRSTFLAMHEAVAPRKVMSVLAEHGAASLRYGTTDFIPDPDKVFSALIDVIYNLRNALFHGSITPNEEHNGIYEPAYHIVMRFVRCTV